MRKLSPRFSNWLDRRIPSSSQITLTQRRIFILPTRAGVGFVAMSVGLLLAGINYENNMLFALAFVIVGLFLISILHTYTNLAGLNLKHLGADAVFNGHHAEFRFVLSRAGDREYHSIALGWPESDRAIASLVDDQKSQVSLFVPVVKRGLMKMGRLKVESRYPLGIFRAWTWLDFNASCLVYPNPVATADPTPTTTDAHDSGNYLLTHGNEEFAGFADYQPGDSLNQISWRNVARGLPAMTEQYQSAADRRLWIEWRDEDRSRVEQALSRMCFQVLQADSSRVEYGLRLPGTELTPAAGSSHRLRALESLALFQTGKNQDYGRRHQ